MQEFDKWSMSVAGGYNRSRRGRMFATPDYGKPNDRISFNVPVGEKIEPLSKYNIVYYILIATTQERI